MIVRPAVVPPATSWRGSRTRAEGYGGVVGAGADTTPPADPRVVVAAAAAAAVEVQTCIGCGARSRHAACPAGCGDEPLDLVALDDVVAIGEAAGRATRRLRALRDVARAATRPGPRAEDLRAAAREALRLPAPGAVLDRVVPVQAWGCRGCGRVDAPRPCIGVCVRRPVPMVELTRIEGLAAALEADAEAAVALVPVVAMIAHVRPRAGREDETRAALAARAAAALAE